LEKKKTFHGAYIRGRIICDECHRDAFMECNHPECYRSTGSKLLAGNGIAGTQPHFVRRFSFRRSPRPQTALYGSFRPKQIDGNEP